MLFPFIVNNMNRHALVDYSLETAKQALACRVQFLAHIL